MVNDNYAVHSFPCGFMENRSIQNYFIQMLANKNGL